MTKYKYTNMANESTEMYVENIYIPAGGVEFPNPIAKFEDLVGLYLNKYIDGVLSNGSKITVVDDREEVTLASNQTVRVVGSTGTTALGSVTVTTMSPLVAGSAAIGTVGVTSLPSIPAGANTIGKVLIGSRDSVGTHANAWATAAVAAAGVSTAVNIGGSTMIAVFGTVSAATNITIQVSQNATNWYDSDQVKNIAAAGDFYFMIPAIGVSNVRLKSSAAATITATVAGK